ncbi:MAG: peptide chain release factor 3, partial [Deltaproteobacteria bacterium]
YITARWVNSDNKKRLATFEKMNRTNLALDIDGNLTYLAASEWRLELAVKEWPEIAFMKTREHD